MVCGSDIKEADAIAHTVAILSDIENDCVPLDLNIRYESIRTAVGHEIVPCQREYAVFITQRPRDVAILFSTGLAFSKEVS